MSGDEWEWWEGGLRPVSVDAIVTVRFRGLPDWTGRAGAVVWRHSGGPGDVVGYKIEEAGQNG